MSEPPSAQIVAWRCERCNAEVAPAGPFGDRGAVCRGCERVVCRRCRAVRPPGAAPLCRACRAARGSNQAARDKE